MGSIVNKINFLKVGEFSEKILIFLIFLFSFCLSFDSDINKVILKIMFSLWIVTFNFKNILYFIKNNKLFLFIIIFALWVFATCIFTQVINYSYEQFIKYFLIPILIFSTTIKIENIKYIISAFLLGIFINEIISYGIYFEIIKSQFLGFDIVGNKYNPVPFLPSHMEYTLFLSLAIILSIFSFFYKNNKIIKSILLIFIITMTTNLFLTTGRTGQFTLLGTLCILLIIYYRHNYKIILAGFSLILIIFSLAFFFSGNTNTRLKQGYSDIVKVINDKEYNTSFGIRLSSYVLIPEIIKDENFNILYGIGYSRTDMIIQKIQVEKFGAFMERQLGHLHNSYITIFAGTGIIGLVLFFLIWYQIFKIKIEDIYFNYIRYSFLFIIVFGSLTENMFRQKEVMMLSAIFISIIIVISSKYIKQGKEKY
ncbi:O-antigen ligase family protein [Aliarcobacter lanthieri]|uniref:O-antigen ligase family protein n=1 Tax=Aliarcobacter lanthieri TaxID=1355374 RepID=UPI003AA939AC